MTANADAAPPSVAGQRWFLVYARPKGEATARLNLAAQGFRAFLPQVRKTVRHARQLRTVRAPLFPRYLFVELDLARDRWLSIRSTIGVQTSLLVQKVNLSRSPWRSRSAVSTMRRRHRAT